MNTKKKSRIHISGDKLVLMAAIVAVFVRSEEHTSELQSH